MMLSVSVYGQSDSVCSEGTPEQRLACLTRAHCPIVVTQEDKADCYRRITLDLLGVPTSTSAQEPVAAAAVIDTTSEPIETSSAMSHTTTAEQISEQNTATGAAASTERDNFGYEWHREPGRQEVVAEINSQIVFLDTLAHGNYLIGLENGQLWLQVSKTRTRLKTGEKVRITRGSLRSFKLFPEKSSATYVSRVVCHGEEPSSLCQLFDDWQQSQQTSG
jgi:hypothetical protein